LQELTHIDPQPGKPGQASETHQPISGISPTMSSEVTSAKCGGWQRANWSPALDVARRTVLMLVADAPGDSRAPLKVHLVLNFEVGANPKAADANGDTAAHLAARRDHLRLLALLSFDAKWLAERQRRHSADGGGATGKLENAPSTCCTCLRQRQGSMSARTARKLEEVAAARTGGSRGSNASDLARLSGHSELASYIERRSGIDWNCSGWPSRATRQGCGERRPAQLRPALQFGCHRALMLAAGNRSCGDEALWEQLVQLAFAPPATAAAVGRVLLDSGADWSLRTNSARLALRVWPQRRGGELAELLRGCNGWQRGQLVTSADAARRTVLMLAADAPTLETPVHTEKCILYLFELGANPKAADANGDTAAHTGSPAGPPAAADCTAVVRCEVAAEQNGATPLMEAARTGSWKCAKHLLHLLRQAIQHGNSKRSRLLKKKDLEGRTASDLARLSGHFRAGQLHRAEEADRLELRRLAKVGDSAGLRRAATRGSCDLTDNDGCTAPRAGNSAAASALLAAGASANATSMWEFTLLMSAAICARPSAAAAVGRVLLELRGGLEA
uniref:ANK_REP_REGION domain-containing protein n=1 Tax=Macrostomum lignano TaxID=282301 RepID=A0A1I8FE07_9PLAT